MAPRGKGKKVSKAMMKKAKKQVARKVKAQVKKGTDTHFMKFYNTFTVTPVQGVSVANYIRLAIPLMTPTITYGVTQNQDFTLYKSLYDRVRVNRVKVTLVPKANTFDAGAAQNDAVLNVTGDGALHSIMDRDNIIGTPASIDAYQKYSTYKVQSVLKPITRSYAVTWPKGVWLDTSNIYGDDSTEIIKKVGCYGGIAFYAENLVEDNGEIFNEPYAVARIEYQCVFMSKKANTISYDAQTGAVTLTPLDDAGIALDPEACVNNVKNALPPPAPPAV